MTLGIGLCTLIGIIAVGDLYDEEFQLLLVPVDHTVGAPGPAVSEP